MEFPAGRDAVIQYLTAYEGVGRKTAETLVDAFGDDKIFGVFGSDPSRIQGLLPPARAEKVLEGWRVDLARRNGGTLAAVPSIDSNETATVSPRTPNAEPAIAAVVPSASAQEGEAANSENATVAEEVPAKSWGRRPRRTRSSAE
jgi:hypothetical protein